VSVENESNDDTAQNYKQMEHDDVNTDEDVEVSIENESNNLNTIEKMNTSEINMNPETDNELLDADEGWRTVTNHRYNLRP